MGTLKCVCSYLSRDIRANQLEHTLLRVPMDKNDLAIIITMKGLDTVESLSAEASANLSANRNHLILLPAVKKWYLFGCWANSRALVYKSCQNISTSVGITKTRTFAHKYW